MPGTRGIPSQMNSARSVDWLSPRTAIPSAPCTSSATRKGLPSEGLGSSARQIAVAPSSSGTASFLRPEALGSQLRPFKRRSNSPPPMALCERSRTRIQRTSPPSASLKRQAFQRRSAPIQRSTLHASFVPVRGSPTGTRAWAKSGPSRTVRNRRTLNRRGTAQGSTHSPIRSSNSAHAASISGSGILSRPSIATTVTVLYAAPARTGGGVARERFFEVCKYQLPAHGFSDAQGWSCAATGYLSAHCP